MSCTARRRAPPRPGGSAAARALLVGALLAAGATVCAGLPASAAAPRDGGEPPRRFDVHHLAWGAAVVVAAVVAVVLCADGGSQSATAAKSQMQYIEEEGMSRRATLMSNVNEGSTHAGPARAGGAGQAFIREEANPLRVAIDKELWQAKQEDEGNTDTRRRHMTLSSDPRWVHPNLNRREAAGLLLEGGLLGRFLVRPKKPEEGLYALDVVEAGEDGAMTVEHHVISRGGTGEFLFDGKQYGRIMSLDALIEFLCRPNNKALRKHPLTDPVLVSEQDHLEASRAPRRKASQA